MAKLTEAQIERLRTIAAYVPNDRWPHAAFWDKSRTDLSLVKRGLIERTSKCDVVYGISFSWNLCKITKAGRLALLQAEG